MVHVKKVEIFGFKSFGFKNTTVQFEPGLVSISGPNGSGKSNILDAIIFAMGENRPKMMRVDKLRSLIHDIEGSRRGPKMARSSVHFDNSDRKIPVDSDSVEITREMDAAGENTYYLNKKKTNRNEVQKLLNLANAGLGQLNAVQQGTVTRISEFSSEEKRKTIEDLIGLSDFDERKAEAAKNLDDADRRLDISLAKMGETKKQIDSLEEDRNQKMRHDLLERELNRYRAISAANKMRTVSGQKSAKESTLGEVTAQVASLGEQRGALKTQIDSLEAERDRLMAQHDDHNQAKVALEKEISAARNAYDTDQSGITASQKRIEQIDNRIPEIKQDLEEITNTRSGINADMLKARESIGETNTRRAKISDALQAVDAKRKKILTEQSEAAAKKSEVDEKIRTLNGQLNDARLKLSKTRHEKKESHDKAGKNSVKYRELEENISAIAEDKSKLESIIKNHEATISELKSRISKRELRKSKITDTIRELEQILDKTSAAANQRKSKIKTVKDFMHEDYTVAKLKEDRDRLGTVGLVYEMISWDKRYERPVLAVSSDWIKSIVVKDFATLLEIAGAARSKKLPKLRIIPLDTIPNFKLKTPNKPGVLGALSDYVKCDPAYSALKTFLFGNVILTESRESAQSVSKAGYKAVTMEGEYFEAKGGTVIININSKISKITKLISMSGDVDELFQLISVTKKWMQKKKHDIKKDEDSIQSHSRRLALSEKELARANEIHANLESRLSSAQVIKKNLSDAAARLREQEAQADSEISTHDSHIDSLKDRISIVEKNYATGEQERIASELAKINVEKTDIENSSTDLTIEYRDKESELTRLQTEDNREKSQSDRLAGEEASLNQQRRDLEDEIQRLERQKKSKYETLVNLRNKEQEIISAPHSFGKVKECNEKLKGLNEKEKELTRQINTLERQSDSLSRDLGVLREEEAKLQQILSAFGFDKDMETFDVEPIVRGLGAELATLTTLNAKAPETYLEISNGYRSMSDRKNMLEAERNEIVKFIENIEKDKKQMFLDAFDKADKEIRLIFNKMTKGNAWLELQNEDDIFNSGISYLIQFPNKPKRESSSISGGEKTLAAVVFVLALQKLEPSPFYLFDEVDAHLDAPNSEKLANILEERARESQFIMVSLKDSVVQKARLIYGVFPKNGVSNVVTYKDKRMPSVKA